MQLLLFLAAALAALGCGGGSTAAEADAANVAVGTTQGTKIADLALKDCDGNVVKLYDLLAGKKAALVDFGAGWCKPCREFQQKAVGFHAKYADKGLVILGVLWQDDNAEPATNAFCKEWKTQYSIPFDEVIDPTNKYTKSFIDAGSTLPVLLVLDSAGVIRFKEVGSAEGDLESIIQDVLEL